MARTKQVARKTQHRMPYSLKRLRQGSIPYVSIKMPRLVYEKYLKHDSNHINILFSTNITQHHLPVEVFQLILSFVPTHALITSCRRVCRSFKSIIENTFAFWRWRLIEHSMQFDDGQELLQSDVTSRTCRFPLLIHLYRDGLFSSRKRDINHRIYPNTNYIDLMILGNFLLHEHEQLELRLPNAKYNISFLSMVRGAHSPETFIPSFLSMTLIIAYDTNTISLRRRASKNILLNILGMLRLYLLMSPASIKKKIQSCFKRLKKWFDFRVMKQNVEEEKRWMNFGINRWPSIRIESGNL
eukprot:gb/GECH01007087.1/.p1 GENE.gb/GECH01007087.1/~~gb/GECH01007087.1/.p1  ORF type:complete len:299 (+),score=11.75 gb/GECH01007087.1/:1-897(+)